MTITLAFFLLVPGFLTAAERILARNGSTSYTIVCPDAMTEGYQFVLKELQMLLKSATKADFPNAKISGQPDGKRIYLGIFPPGIAPGSLADQEHCILTDGEDLYLFGGGKNGTRYAVYDFLQNVLGFRFFDARDGISFPDKTQWKLPSLDRKRLFSFPVRRTTQYWLFNHPHSIRFLYRNAQNNAVAAYFAQNGITSTPDDFQHLNPLGHSLPLYLPCDDKASTFGWIRELKQNLWQEHPEYFSMASDGKRIPHHQYCLSNPDLRKLLIGRILENMKRNPQYHSFDISANDTPGRFCHCPKCLALEKKYEATGGPLFDFILELCPLVEKQFPGKWITTLIYRKDQTQHPPKNISRFPDNFAPVFAPIDDNFAKDWSHPDNLETYEDLKTWCRLSNMVLVWYYPNPYSGNITPPFGNLEKLANDIRLMKDAGVKGMVWEHNVGVPEMIGFSELQSYVALQLFQDCTRSYMELADEFIIFEYGKAAALMKSYWLELEELRKNELLQFAWNPNPQAYFYLQPERLVRWNNLFDQMENLLQDDPGKKFNVQRVRVNLDFAILRKFLAVKRDFPDFPVSAEMLAERLRKNYTRAVQEFFCKKQFQSRADNYLKILEDQLLMILIQSGTSSKPLPQEIFGEIPADRIFVSMPKVNGSSLLKDQDAAFGWSAVFSKGLKSSTGWTAPSLPFKADLEDISGKKYQQDIGRVTKKEIGEREKYQFYKIARIKITPDCIFRMGLSDWFDFKTQIGGAYVMGAFNNAEVYASLKFKGPAFYTEDAGKENLVYCDRVVVVRLD